MSDGTSRREFVTKALLGATAAPLAIQALRPSVSRSRRCRPPRRGRRPSSRPSTTRASSLLPGPMKAQYDTMRAYYYAIPDDDILKGFRMRAGQRARGKDLGGWYSGEPNRRFWWSNGDTFNTFGQWLSGMARMSKATGDAEMRSKAIFLMGEWASTIEPDGWFFYSRRPWQPHYIYDKQVGGLVDMAVYAGRKDALTHLSKITDWAIENLDRSRKLDSDTEWYTLSENLYRAYQVTGDEKYRRFGDLWRFDDYWNAFSGAAPTDVKRHGHHAYSHVNTMSSCAMTYAVTGEKPYLDAIVNEYDWLQKTQCYATGGYGPEEDLVPEDGELGRRLETTSYSFETTCGSWGGFKLARYLLTYTGRGALRRLDREAPLQRDARRPADGTEGRDVLLLRLPDGRRAQVLPSRRQLALLLGHLPAGARRLPQRRLLPGRGRASRQPLRPVARGVEPGRHARLGRAGDDVPGLRHDDADGAARQERGLRREVPGAGLDAGRRGRGQREAVSGRRAARERGPSSAGPGARVTA